VGEDVSTGGTGGGHPGRAEPWPEVVWQACLNYRKIGGLIRGAFLKTMQIRCCSGVADKPIEI
jgi:hypothetical protein